MDIIELSLAKAVGYNSGFVDGWAYDTEWLATGGAVTRRYNPVATMIGQNVFAYNEALEEIYFPAVETVDAFSFLDCIALHSVNLPALVSVGVQAFRNCSAITKLDFPCVTHIERIAFRGCSTLVALILRAPTVCVLAASTTMMDTPIANGTGFVYVPDDLVEQYKTATNWATYADQIKPISALGVSE